MGISTWTIRLAGAVGRRTQNRRHHARAGLQVGLGSPASAAPIRWPDDLASDDTSDELKYRAGIVAGHLLRDLRSTAPTPSEQLLCASAAYAAALVTPQGQRHLVDETDRSVLNAHLYATLLIESHGHRLSATEEQRLLAWLLEQAGLTLDTPLQTRMLRLRARRDARLGRST